jgi:hypothetical protein
MFMTANELEEKTVIQPKPFGGKPLQEDEPTVMHDDRYRFSQSVIKQQSPYAREVFRFWEKLPLERAFECADLHSKAPNSHEQGVRKILFVADVQKILPMSPKITLPFTFSELPKPVQKITPQLKIKGTDCCECGCLIITLIFFVILVLLMVPVNLAHNHKLSFNSTLIRDAHFNRTLASDRESELKNINASKELVVSGWFDAKAAIQTKLGRIQDLTDCNQKFLTLECQVSESETCKKVKEVVEEAQYQAKMIGYEHEHLLIEYQQKDKMEEERYKNILDMIEKDNQEERMYCADQSSGTRCPISFTNFGDSAPPPSDLQREVLLENSRAPGWKQTLDEYRQQICNRMCDQYEIFVQTFYWRDLLAHGKLLLIESSSLGVFTAAFLRYFKERTSVFFLKSFGTCGVVTLGVLKLLFVYLNPTEGTFLRNHTQHELIAFLVKQAMLLVFGAGH